MKKLTYFLLLVTLLVVGCTPSTGKKESLEKQKQSIVEQYIKNATSLKSYHIDFKMHLQKDGKGQELSYVGDIINAPKAVNIVMKIKEDPMNIELPVYLVDNTFYIKSSGIWLAEASNHQNNQQLLSGLNVLHESINQDFIKAISEEVKIEEKNDHYLLTLSGKTEKGKEALKRLGLENKDDKAKINQVSYQIQKNTYLPMHIIIDIEDAQERYQFNVQYSNVNEDIQIVLPEEAKKAIKK